MDATLHKILDLMWKNKIKEIDFCTSIGINKSAVTDWKNGKTTSYKRHLPAIAELFNVPVDYFDDNLSSGNETKKEPALEDTYMLSDDEKAIVDMLRLLDPEKRNALITLLKDGQKD